MKNIVICFDVNRDFGLNQQKSNCLKFYSAVERDESQLAIYVPSPSITSKAEGGGFGKVLESVVKFSPVGLLLALGTLWSNSSEKETMKRLFVGNGTALQLQAALEAFAR